jgi:hypothetical protein
VLVLVSGGTLDRIRIDGKNSRCRKYEGERRSLGSSAMQCCHECDRSGDDRDPGKSGKASEQATNVGQVGGCDEWQLGSGLRQPNIRPLPERGRNHSAGRAIKANWLTVRRGIEE